MKFQSLDRIAITLVSTISPIDHESISFVWVIFFSCKGYPVNPKMPDDLLKNSKYIFAILQSSIQLLTTKKYNENL